MSDRRKSPTADSLRNRIRYNFDNLLARGTWAVLLFLGVVTLAAVLLSSLLLTAFQVTLAGSEGETWLEDFWQSLMRVMDPGTMVADVGWGRRLLALVITTVGLLIAGTLIGLIANGIEQRVQRMQRGRSIVVESRHVVILGASARLPVVIQQLVLAGAKRRRSAIVVLSDHEPAEANEEVRTVVTDTLGSRLVFRWGDPTRPVDLGMVGIREARAVMVLADEDAQGDAGVVKAVLAAGAQLGGFDRVPIIAELSDPETAESLARATDLGVHTVVALLSVARTSTFALREPGLNQVVEELLDFGGSDIYLRDQPDLIGLPFGEIVFRFARARPIGRMRPSGDVEINPNPAIRFEAGDRLIVIAADGENFEPAGNAFSGPSTLSSAPLRLDTEPREEHFLVIGWNALGTQLLRQWEQLASPGSTVEVVYDPRLFEPDEVNIPTGGGLDVTLTPSRKATWQLGTGAQNSHFTSILLLGYRRGMTPEEADSRTLLNLMLLRRDLESWVGTPAPRVIVELLDADNVALANLTGADDYLVSDAIASRFLAQLAEQPGRRAVFSTLYAADGPSLHLVPAPDLGLTGDVSWADLVATAYSHGLLAIGRRRAPERGGDLVLNPHHSDRVRLEEGDQIVVIG